MPNRKEVREWNRINKEKYGGDLFRVEKSEWPETQPGWSRPIDVIGGLGLISLVFQEGSGRLRISARWAQIGAVWDKTPIGWEALQAVKNFVAPQRAALEIYPVEGREVNVANMRHLWVLPEKTGIPFGWDPEGNFAQ